MQRANKRKYHYIYKITRDDGRYYIGMHSTDDLEDGYFGSGKLITRSIKKHGIERHEKEILEFLESRELLKTREKELITDDIRSDLLCMNIAPGGGGGFKNKQHQIACCVAGGKVAGKIKHPCKGFKLGHTYSRDAVLAGTHFTKGMLGKTHSHETKVKMSIAQSANGNSQFGTCWVTNNTRSIKIKKEQLNEYLNSGYVRGRRVAKVY